MRLAIRTAIALVLFCLVHAVRAQDPAGHWRGTWTDTNTGHHGPIKANITQCDATHYNAVFSGRFFGVMPFRFAAVLEVTGTDGDATLLAGTWHLPLFGQFTYNARVTSTCFTMNFCSRRYTGNFVMQRECSTCGHH